MKHQILERRFLISTKHEGQNHEGYYVIEGDMIRVSDGTESEETQLGGSSAFPESLAQTILGELVMRRKRNGGND